MKDNYNNVTSQWTSVNVPLRTPVEIAPVAKAGTLVACPIPGGMADCVVEDDIVFPNLEVDYLKWKNGPKVSMTWPTANGKEELAGFIGRYPGDSLTGFSAGCQDWPEWGGVLNRAFAIRYIASESHDTLKFLMKPVFWVSDVCQIP